MLQAENMVVSGGGPSEGPWSDIFCLRDFRSCKVFAICIILSHINSDAVLIRRLESTLMLVAALVYLTNSLHSRPDNNSHSQKLQKAIFPLTNDLQSRHLLIRHISDERMEREYPEGVPCAIGGVMYLRDFLIKPPSTSFQFVVVSLLNNDLAFKRVFGCLREDTMRVLFKAGITQRAQLIGYVPQRKGYTKKRAPKEAEQLEPQFPELADTVVEIVVKTEDGDLPTEDVHLGKQMEDIMQQYATDIMQKIGPPRDNSKLSTYSSLTQYDRQHLSLNDISTLNLGNLFTQVQWRRATKEDWQKAQERIFPAVDHQVSQSQYHLKNCRYFNNYLTLVQLLPSEQAIEVQQTFHKKLDELPWLPETRLDRLWVYKKGDKTWNKVPNAEHRRPRIIVNPHTGGHVTIENHAVAGRGPSGV